MVFDVEGTFKAILAALKAEAGWGRATYDLSLTRLAKHYLGAAANKELTEDEREGSAAKGTRTEASRHVLLCQRPWSPSISPWSAEYTMRV